MPGRRRLAASRGRLCRMPPCLDPPAAPAPPGPAGMRTPSTRGLRPCWHRSTCPQIPASRTSTPGTWESGRPRPQQHPEVRGGCQGWGACLPRAGAGRAERPRHGPAACCCSTAGTRLTAPVQKDSKTTRAVPCLPPNTPHDALQSPAPCRWSVAGGGGGDKRRDEHLAVLISTGISI